MFAPRPVSSELKDIDLTDKLFPWKGDQPVLLSMPLSNALYLPLFNLEGSLRAVLKKVGVPFERIKKVDDGRVFLESLPKFIGIQPLKVILNPRFTETGTVRFTEVQ